MIIPEIHLIFDLISDFILFNFRFNFHIGTTPPRCPASVEGRPLASAPGRVNQTKGPAHSSTLRSTKITNQELHSRGAQTSHSRAERLPTRCAHASEQTLGGGVPLFAANLSAPWGK